MANGRGPSLPDDRDWTTRRELPPIGRSGAANGHPQQQQPRNSVRIDAPPTANGVHGAAAVTRNTRLCFAVFRANRHKDMLSTLITRRIDVGAAAWPNAFVSVNDARCVCRPEECEYH